MSYSGLYSGGYSGVYSGYSGSFGSSSCASVDWNAKMADFSANAFASVVTPTVIAVIFSIILCCFLCSPDMNKKLDRRMKNGLTCATVMLTLLFIFSPLIGTAVSCGRLTDQVCKSCSDGSCDKDALYGGCTALFTVLTYTAFCGWSTVAAATTMGGLSCCLCCSKDPEPNAAPPQVIMMGLPGVQPGNVQVMVGNPTAVVSADKE
mmetsp:Transcript_79123/g.139678  ORF Transcript_79123/g.139678 Transcript_79123/m.139678 type:complete len:206 (-) Transcript_79123:212-829(-)